MTRIALIAGSSYIHLTSWQIEAAIASWIIKQSLKVMIVSKKNFC